MGPYLNRQDLADTLVSAVRQLRQAQAQTYEQAHSVRSMPLSTVQWRLGDRLYEADMERLIAAFTAGTPKRKLAERYGISESSVKRLIRQHGASKASSGLSRYRLMKRQPGCDISPYGVATRLNDQATRELWVQPKSYG
jgi:hypothetical protein